MSQNNDFNRVPEGFKKAGVEHNFYGNRTPKKSKKGLIVLIVFIILILLTLGIGYGLYTWSLSPIDPNSDEDITFSVEEGDTSDEVGKTLLEKGLIRDVNVFKIYVRLNKVNHFTEGKYRTNKQASLKELVDMIVEGKIDLTTVTFKILEGRNLRHIAKEANEIFGIQEKEFLDTMKDVQYIDSLISKYWFLTNSIKDANIIFPLEGYLFPDTYFFAAEGTTSKLIYETMLNRTEEILEVYKKYYIDENGQEIKELKVMPIHQVMTLASVAELEGLSDDSKKEIVGVFINRLQNGMSLGSDPTTAYAFDVNMADQDLTQTQIDTEHPYNTRGPNMEGKIPVGPIGSPSKVAIDSTFNYKKTDNLYFVSDNEGNIYFTKTYQEHEAKIQELINAGKWHTYDD